MAISAGRVTVTAAAPVALNTGAVAQTLTIKHLTSNLSCELGPAGITAGTGYILWPSEQRVIELEAGEVLYAINYAQADVELCVLRT